MRYIHQATHRSKTGGFETAEYVEIDGTNLFMYAHVPSCGSEIGVVVCSPIHAEFVRNYRREVLLGRALAERGIAVQRFHYRGQGNSGGDGSLNGYASMVEDATLAAGRLNTLAGVRRVAFFGSRFGALIAAAVAAREPTTIAFWDPVLGASQYFREAFRAQKIESLHAQDAPSDGGSLTERLTRDGSIPILGYTITRNLYESSKDRTLEGELGSTARDVFVLRMGKDPRTEKRFGETLSRWRMNGSKVSEVVLAQREAWWFTAGDAASKEALDRATDATLAWLTTSLIEER